MSRAEQGPLHTDVQNTNELISFLKYYFLYDFVPDYFTRIRTNFDLYPWRAENPNYLQLFARVSLMSAEYGFHQSSGDISLHNKHKHTLDVFDPRLLLGIGTYMSYIMLQLIEQKIALLETLQKEYGIRTKDTFDILEQSVIPVSGVVSVDKAGIYPERRTHHLPILLPDIKFCKEVRGIPFKYEQASRISKQEFGKNVLGKAQQVFSWLDLTSVFYNPNELWE